MLVNAVWKWRGGEYLLQTGCLTCKSLPQAVFDERLHALPRNPVECGYFGHMAYFQARLAFTMAAFNVLVQWHGLRPTASGFVPLLIAGFSL